MVIDIDDDGPKKSSPKKVNASSDVFLLPAVLLLAQKLAPYDMFNGFFAFYLENAARNPSVEADSYEHFVTFFAQGACFEVLKFWIAFSFIFGITHVLILYRAVTAAVCGVLNVVSSLFAL